MPLKQAYAESFDSLSEMLRPTPVIAKQAVLTYIPNHSMSSSSEENIVQSKIPPPAPAPDIFQENIKEKKYNEGEENEKRLFEINSESDDERSKESRSVSNVPQYTSLSLVKRKESNIKNYRIKKEKDIKVRRMHSKKYMRYKSRDIVMFDQFYDDSDEDIIDYDEDSKQMEITDINIDVQYNNTQIYRKKNVKKEKRKRKMRNKRVIGKLSMKQKIENMSGNAYLKAIEVEECCYGPSFTFFNRWGNSYQ